MKIPHYQAKMNGSHVTLLIKGVGIASLNADPRQLEDILGVSSVKGNVELSAAQYEKLDTLRLALQITYKNVGPYLFPDTTPSSVIDGCTDAIETDRHISFERDNTSESEVLVKITRDYDGYIRYAKGDDKAGLKVPLHNVIKTVV